MTTLTDPLRLPCGAVLPNRLAKAAMTEGLADHRGVPSDALIQLYRLWAESGCGLLVTGNVAVDADHLERPGNVILDGPPTPEKQARLREWTRACTAQGAQVWIQLSHAGRQTQRLVNPRPRAPSSVKLGVPGGQFGTPRALREPEIEALVERFASAAAYAKEVGFTGVQIHAAHGYLLSQFLSPRANQRDDRWGGSLENRARFLLAIVAATRARVGAGFPIGVKLNSADFQKGGFEAHESVQVAKWLEAAGVDLLELSGGSYESPAMIGADGLEPDAKLPPKAASTLAREAYFFDFARAMRAEVRMPIMLTGRLRTRAGMQAALDEGVDVLGVARPLCVDTRCTAKLLRGELDALPSYEDALRTGTGLFSPSSPVPQIRALLGFADIYWFYAQFHRLGRGAAADLSLSPLRALAQVMRVSYRLVRARRRGKGRSPDEAERSPRP